MNIPSDRKYSKSHEWAKDLGDGTILVGISDHAQEALGDVVFVELPEVGASFNAGDEYGVVESVKAASDVYAPVSGEVIEVNSSLEDSPEQINSSPYEDGWMIKLKMQTPSELDDLLDADAYQQVAEEDQ